jgi:lysophospholipase L1-like esterase
VSRSSLIHLVGLVVSLSAMACSSNGTTPEGGTSGQSSGAMPSSGGKTGSGGTASGGTAGSGGQTGEGGKVATGGSSGTGGSSVTGGSSATGGTSAGTAGSSAAGTAGGIGTGGSASSGGAGAAGHTTGGGSPGGGGGSAGGGAGGGGAVGGSGGHVGGTAGTSSVGGAGGGGYNPCKASPCVILPLGDSITHGFSSTDDAGYRSALFKLIVAANQNVTFIGSLSNGPASVSSKTFPKNHEGHDGISVTGITGYVPPAKSFSTTPHIVLLHIGTNDMTSNADPTTTANQLSTLLTNLVNAAPDALIVVAKIVPLGYSNANYTSYVAKISDVVKAHAGKNVVMVDMSTLPTSDIRGSGNVHPTDQGYVDMANIWYGAIKGYLPQ